MKKLLFILAMVLIPTLSFSAPFLYCDPQTGVTDYKLTGPAWVPATVAAQADGSIKMDVSGANVGSNSLTVAACKTDPVWGQLCSSFVPFTFTRPAAPTIPGTIKLGL